MDFMPAIILSRYLASPVRSHSVNQAAQNEHQSVPRLTLAGCGFGVGCASFRPGLTSVSL